MTQTTNKNTFLKKHGRPVKVLLFCLILSMLLETLSWLSLITLQNPNPMADTNARAIFDEPKNTVDLVAIGNSNVRSGIIPMQLWKDYGITGYAWGEPAVDPFDAELYLKKIFKKQSPSVVVLEASFFFRNTTLTENLNSRVKSGLASICPLISYHSTLTKLFKYSFRDLMQATHSVTKGYFVNFKAKSSKKGKTYMKKSSSDDVLSPIVEKQVLKIEKLCKENGAQLIITALPSTSDWGYKRHELTEEFCSRNQLEFLDMNTSDALEAMNMNWKNDTRDGGTHLNYYGASLATGYLGQYLAENHPMTDFRGKSEYQQWEEDCRYFYNGISQIEEGKEKQKP